MCGTSDSSFWGSLFLIVTSYLCQIVMSLSHLESLTFCSPNPVTGPSSHCFHQKTIFTLHMPLKYPTHVFWLELETRLSFLSSWFKARWKNEWWSNLGLTDLIKLLSVALKHLSLQDGDGEVCTLKFLAQRDLWWGQTDPAESTCARRFFRPPAEAKKVSTALPFSFKTCRSQPEACSFCVSLCN